MTGKCAKDEKKSSDQLSCTDVETLRAVDVVQRLGRRLVHPPPHYYTERHPKIIIAYTANMLTDTETRCQQILYTIIQDTGI